MEDDPGMDQKQTMLSKVPLFAGLGSHDLGRLAQLCDEVDLKPDFVLTRQGATASEFFVILAGTIRIDRDGQHVRDLGPGDYLGELALLAKGPRTATATTAGPSRVLVLTRQAFNELLMDHPKIQMAVLCTMADRVKGLEADAHH
jgi:CRP-like cAMP-binding protein